MHTGHESFDVVIVGAGPAGLSAALVLGRCCRNVLVVDSGTPRSWASRAMHGYLSRDGIHPRIFNDIARQEISRYPNVTLWDGQVEDIEADLSGFDVSLADHRKAHCRKVLLATGLLDDLPAIPHIEDFFGISVFQCPYCDGWERRNRPLAVYANGARAMSMARAMTAWSRYIVLCSDGPARLSKKEHEALRAHAIAVVEQKVSGLEGADGQMTAIRFSDGSCLARDALFFDLPSHPQSRLPQRLGCSFSRDGRVKCGDYEATSVPGVYIAGNIVGDVQFSIVAAAEGAKAAFGMNRSLTREDFQRTAEGVDSVEHPAVDKVR